MTALRRPLGDVTVYGYDDRGFLTSELAANGTVLTYTHDAAGRV